MVGVCGDIKHFLMTDDPTSMIIVPLAQSPRNRRFFLARTNGDPMGLAPMLRTEIDAIDAGLPLTLVRSMRQVADESMGIWGGTAAAFGGLGIGALVLAALGLYSLIAYSVGQRIHELGIRIALGASRGDIIGLVVRRGLWLTGFGLFIGAIGAVFAGRLMGSLLFGIAANDAMTFALTAVILLGSAVLACWLPARKAAGIDPMVALRSE